MSQETAQRQTEVVHPTPVWKSGCVVSSCPRNPTPASLHGRKVTIKIGDTEFACEVPVCEVHRNW